jgi:3-(3-hydroxy-phenyl)propionate hydroxylase
MNSSAAKATVDVAVVGCGPVGLTLTRLLELQGLRVAAVDRTRLPVAHPRATHLDDETMRTFQTLGLQELEKHFSLVGRYRHLDGEGRPLMEMDMNGGLTEQGWQSDYMFHQPDFEAVTRGYAEGASGTSTYFGWDAVGLQESAEAVTVNIRELSTGQETEISASYVVGCDGSHSKVSGLMGVSEVDHHATHRSLIIDIWPYVAHDELVGRDMFIQGGIRNPLTFVPIAEPRVRFELMLRPEDDQAEFERTAKAAEVLGRWLRPHEYRILRLGVYEWRSRTAQPWKLGRTFLAGDAAHTMPPHLGQGMCSGVRDSINLAWKLARVLQHESPAELLDTYQTEREPHVEAYITTSAQMANGIEAMEARGAGDGEVPVLQAQPLRPRLGSGIRMDDADPYAGFLSAQPRLTNGQLLDDVVGYRFAVVGDPACLSETTAATQELVDSLGISVVDDNSDEIRQWLDKLGVKAVVVRPDRYVFGTASSGAELDAVVGELGLALTRSRSVPVPV